MGPVTPGCSVFLRAPAKVNLSLRVLGRRPDGYHDLDTVMQKLDLSDLVTIAISKEPGIVLQCPDSDLPVNCSNSVYRAAAVFRSAWGGRAGQGSGCDERRGIIITLEKRIPIAAGLGGGSSDAGAVLVGLNRLLNARFSTVELVALARPLGADVPFFVTDYRAVRATGIGDQMTEIPSLQNCSVVLVNPGFTVSTRWVYEKYALTMADKDSKLCDSQNEECSALTDVAVNDLERVTIPSYPEIQVLKQNLFALGASSVLMSGSGPTVFAVFPDEDDQRSSRVQHAVHALQYNGVHGLKIFVTQPV